MSSAGGRSWVGLAAGLGLLLVVAVAAGAMVAAWLLRGPLLALTGSFAPPTSPSSSGPSTEPSESQRSRPAPPRPSAEPEPSTPAPPDRSRKSNSVYDVELPRGSARCRAKVRAPGDGLDDSAYAPYVRKLVACLVDVYAEPLAAQGFTLKTPKVKAFRNSVKSPCGRISAGAAPAAYCGTSRTIYVSVTADDSAGGFSSARLGYVELAAHEFAHHVQSSTGILADVAASYDDISTSRRYAVTRRVELQADCFAGASIAAAADALELTEQDRDELRLGRTFTGDEDPPEGRRPDHGTSRAQVRWLLRGLDSADLGRCNTWKATKKSVT